MRFRYQDLRVSDELLNFIELIYSLTATFPSDERFGLTSQLRRAVNSSYLNVAEGTARKSPKDFARFITIALGSLVEVHAACKIAERQKFITAEQILSVENAIQPIWFKLHALRESQRKP